MDNKTGFAYQNACVSQLAVLLKSFGIRSLFLFEKLYPLPESFKIDCLNSIRTKKYARSIKCFYTFPCILIAFSFSPIYKVTDFGLAIVLILWIGLIILNILGAR